MKRLDRFGWAIGCAALFAAGAWRTATDDGDAADGWGMMAVALVLTGVAITVHLHDKWHDR